MSHHTWIVGRDSAALESIAASAASAQAPARIAVDCHRRLRGPYAGAGSLLRVLVPQLAGHRDDLTRVHAAEIVAITPDLKNLVDAPPETLTELATRDERTRVYARTQTARLAHGLVDLLLAWAAQAESGAPALSFSRVDQADHTDQEFLAILLRRVPSDIIAVTVVTRDDKVCDQLVAALRAYTHRMQAREPERPDRQRTTADLVSAFVAADGTSTDPAEIAAYENTDLAHRVVLHDERAAELERSGEWSLRLGAIPYHREHGSDRMMAVKVLRESLEHCLFRGYYHAAIDFGLRGRAISGADDGLDYWYLNNRTGIGYTAIDKPSEAEALYRHARRDCVIPGVYMFTGYAMAMLYTRILPPEQRDHDLAREYVNGAIALGEWCPDARERTFHVVFNKNGLALVEMHAGDLPKALKLVTEGRAQLIRELGSEAYGLHQSVLTHNAASLLVRMERLDESLSMFGEAIRLDPNYPEYYFDRAAVLRRLGRPEEALKDYDTAIAVSLPFWELHYNRGAVRAELGDITGAIADFERVADLEPGELDPWVSMAGLLLELDDPATARARIDQGLAFHPDDPLLICLRAQAHAAQGRTDLAWQDYDLALAGDAALTAALAGRADLAYTAGDHRSAIADLTRAIDTTPDDPDLRYNRALLYQATSDWHAAISDYTHALTLPGTDQDDIHAGLHHCHTQLRHETAASGVTS